MDRSWSCLPGNGRAKQIRDSRICEPKASVALISRPIVHLFLPNSKFQILDSRLEGELSSPKHSSHLSHPLDLPSLFFSNRKTGQLQECGLQRVATGFLFQFG